MQVTTNFESFRDRQPITPASGVAVSSEDRVMNNAATRALASAKTMGLLVDSLLLFGRAESKFQAKDLELINLCDLARDELTRWESSRPEEWSRIKIAVPEEALVLSLKRLTTLRDIEARSSPRSTTT